MAGQLLIEAGGVDAYARPLDLGAPFCHLFRSFIDQTEIQSRLREILADRGRNLTQNGRLASLGRSYNHSSLAKTQRHKKINQPACQGFGTSLQGNTPPWMDRRELVKGIARGCHSSVLFGVSVEK